MFFFFRWSIQVLHYYCFIGVWWIIWRNGKFQSSLVSSFAHIPRYFISYGFIVVSDEQQRTEWAKAVQGVIFKSWLMTWLGLWKPLSSPSPFLRLEGSLLTKQGQIFLTSTAKFFTAYWHRSQRRGWEEGYHQSPVLTVLSWNMEIQI